MNTTNISIPSSAEGSFEFREYMRQRGVFWVLLAVSAFATSPVWLPAYPPMTDLPQHAAQITLFSNLHNPRFEYADLFNINWFTPYLLGYILLYSVTPLLGIVAACKLVISVSLIALPLSTALLMRETGADEYWALLTIPAMYGFSYYWGFLNFIVATPLGVLFVWVLIRYFRSGEKKNLLWIALLLNLLFFCHALICAFAALIGIFYTACEGRSFRRTLTFCLTCSSVLPLALVWLWKSRQVHPTRYAFTQWDLGWFDTIEPYYKGLASWAEPVHPGWGRISGFVPRLLGVEPRLEYVLVASALFLMPVLAGSRFSRRLAVWTPFLVCALVLLFAPSVWLGTAFVFQRFTVFALPFFLIALSAGTPVSQRRQNLFRVAGVLIVTAWIAAICVRTKAYDREAIGFTSVLSKMEPNQRVLSLDFERDSTATISPSFAHFAAWYSAEKQGIVDPSNAYWYVELIRYNPGKVPKAKLWDFEWNPAEFSWDSYEGGKYRYFLVSALSDQGSSIFRDAKCPVHLKYSASIWWLYEQDSRCRTQDAAFAASRLKETGSAR
jgi:hypothetical protein